MSRFEPRLTRLESTARATAVRARIRHDEATTRRIMAQIQAHVDSFEPGDPAALEYVMAIQARVRAGIDELEQQGVS